MATLEIEIDRFGRLVKGPVMWIMDTEQGRMANLDDEGWDEWAEEMWEKGIIINGLLPNSTTVMAIMDKLFRAFKGALKHSIHGHYAKKIKANAKQVQRRKAEIASKVARGEATSETELAKTRLVVGLNQMDLGPILFRELLEDEFANPSSPIATRFTKKRQ